jgi:hypothetical protein
LLVGDEPIGVPYQGGQHDELEVRELNRVVSHPRLMCGQVQAEVAADEDVVDRVR